MRCEDCSDGSCVNCIVDAQAIEIVRLKKRIAELEGECGKAGEFEAQQAKDRGKLESRIARAVALLRTSTELDADTLARRTLEVLR